MHCRIEQIISILEFFGNEVPKLNFLENGKQTWKGGRRTPLYWIRIGDISINVMNFLQIIFYCWVQLEVLEAIIPE